MALFSSGAGPFATERCGALARPALALQAREDVSAMSSVQCLASLVGLDQSGHALFELMLPAD